MERTREIDRLPSKVAGRRREGAPTLAAAQTLQQTFRALRGGVGLAPRGLYRFSTFEEAQENVERLKRALSVLEDDAAREIRVSEPRSPAPRVSSVSSGWA